MTAYDGARLAIVVGSPDMFDYDLFCQACSNAGVPALQLGEWAQKIGMVQVALRRHPDLSPLEAYQRFVSEMNNSLPVVTTEDATRKQAAACGSCGGGRIR